MDIGVRVKRVVRTMGADRPHVCGKGRVKTVLRFDRIDSLEKASKARQGQVGVNP